MNDFIEIKPGEIIDLLKINRITKEEYRHATHGKYLINFDMGQENEYLATLKFAEEQKRDAFYKKICLRMGVAQLLDHSTSGVI